MKKGNKISDYVKASRKGSREAELELFQGFPNYKKYIILRNNIKEI
jgi:hypothetical protein